MAAITPTDLKRIEGGEKHTELKMAGIAATDYVPLSS